MLKWFRLSLFLRLWVSLGLAGLAPGWVFVPAVHADAFTVDIGSDENNGCTPGACSLREAILAANGTGGADTIVLPAGTYTLTLAGTDDVGAVGDLDLTGSVTLSGAGADTTIINANGLDRVLDIWSGQVTLSGLTLRNGAANNGGGLYLHSGSVVTLSAVRVMANTTTNNGGGIYNNGGALTLDQAQVLSNTAPNAGSGNGGGLYNLNGAVTITNASLFQGNAANANSLINAGLGGAIHIENGPMLVSHSTLAGNFANDGGGISLGAGASVTLTSALITGNSAGDDGAGIENDDGAVALYDSIVLSNTASLTDTNGEGGGLNNGNGLGTLVVVNSLISGNSARNGGGISNDGGRVTLLNSTVSNNTAPAGSGRGGGINNYDASIPVTLTITNSLISGNSSGGDGGGIRHGGAAGTLTLDNSTLSGNTSTSSSGGGLRNEATATLANVTLALNNAATSGDGLRNTGTLVIRNSLLANNDTQNCLNGGTLTSQGYNLKSDGSCNSVFIATGDMTNTLTALIGPLQNNGGPTLSHAPLGASPGAIDAGNPAGCLGTAGGLLVDDQRGFTRPVNGRCDIGAVEYTLADVSVTINDGLATTVPGLPLTYTVAITNGGAITVSGATVTATASAALVSPAWSCAASAGSACPASGTGALNASLTLAPLGLITFTITGAVAPNAVGTLTHTSTITLPLGVTDPVPSNNSATDTDVLAPQSDLGLTKTDGQAAALPGTPLTYTIVVTNAGPSDAPGVWVTDVFPSGFENVAWSCTASSGSTCPGNGTGDIGVTIDLQANDQATFTATGVISTAVSGPLTNTALLSGASDTTPANNTATDSTLLTAAVDLGLALTDQQTTAAPGTALSYTLVVSNAGPSPATGAVVTSAFPSALENVVWACTASPGSQCDLASGAGEISATVSIPASGMITFTVNGVINAAATGTLTTSASVSPAPADVEIGPLPNAATDVDVLTPLADLLISVGDGLVSTTAGSPITYTLTLTNSGPSAASGVVMTDIFPSALETITWTCLGLAGGLCPAAGAGDILTNAIDMPPGASVMFVATGHVALAASGWLSNTASVAPPSGVTDPQAGNNTSTDGTWIVPITTLYRFYLPILLR